VDAASDALARTGADLFGNPVTGDADALAAVDDFLAGFLAYEKRAGKVIKAAVAHPAHGLLNLYAASLMLLMETPQGPTLAAPFLVKAQAAELNERERATAAFVGAWMRGEVPAAEAIGEAALRRWPRDLGLLKLCHYLCFNRGDFGTQLRQALISLPAAADVPEMHGLAAFAYEECHLMRDAERAARTALERKPSDAWAQHALAHVLLTEARTDEGVAFLGGASRGWGGLNSFMSGHNWWHLCLFYLSQGRGAAVLDAYDAHVWGAADQDYSQDQVGAVSLLARAEMAGIDVGERWEALAARIAARGADVEQPFLALQYLYALCRAARVEAPTLLAAIRARAAAAPAFARTAWAEAALPAAEGIAAHLAGAQPKAAAELAAALPQLAAIGGSHAQRDLFEQIWLAALVADGRWSAAQNLLEHRRAYDPNGVPLNRLLARAYDALGLPAQAAEARERADATARLAA
jgi:hypothetical protein